MNDDEPGADGRHPGPEPGEPDACPQARLWDAIQKQQAGRLAEAEVVYEALLAEEPGNADAWHFASVLALQMNNPSAAILRVRRAVECNPSDAELHNTLGKVLLEQRHREEAAGAFEHAIRLNPNHGEAHQNLGRLLRDRRDLQGAERHFRIAVSLDRSSAAAHSGLGATLRDQERRQEAKESFERALREDRWHRGATLGLGKLLADEGRFPEAAAVLRREFDQRRANTPPDSHLDTYRLTTRAKLRHDLDQIHYLGTQGISSDSLHRAAKEYERLLAEIEWGKESHGVVELLEVQHARIAAVYNRAAHVADAPAVQGSPINPLLDTRAVTRDYFAAAPGMVYFDGFLTNEALAGLRQFCLRSTLWYDFSHPHGYLGAYLDDGFACPLVLQIANGLRCSFSDIIGELPLEHIWAYKYDSRLSGIGTHADFAAVNVNFWITPDDANLDPHSGGLVVYRTEAPRDWEFTDYNHNPERVKSYLIEQGGQKPLVIPHRQNRAVIFNSSLFHETDAIHFRPEYENRRINVTMLFGKR
jgi:tetratricopeptide (TPR) repeat protein